MNINTNSPSAECQIPFPLSKIEAKLLNRILVYFLDSITNFDSSAKIIGSNTDTDELYSRVLNIQKRLHDKIGD